MEELALQTANTVLFALAFRALPFGIAALFTDWVSPTRRAAIVSIWLVVFCTFALNTPLPLDRWLETGFVFLYLTLLSVFAWWVANRARRLPRPFLFPAAALASVAVPAAVVSGFPRMMALVFGFEYMFSVSSYVDSAKTAREGRSLGDALMFLLVNPTLVYPERGQPTKAPSHPAGTAARWLFGVGTLCVHHLGTLLVPSIVATFYARFVPHAGLASIATSLAVSWIYLVVWYLGHSGAASLQIAGMRALGWSVPERYNYPFLARSPEDFWRRWNTYLTSWLHRYIFVPVGVALLRRKSSAGSGLWQKALAVLLTFAVCGIAHEYTKFVEFHMFVGGALAGFLFAGLVYIAWAGLGRLWRIRQNRLHVRDSTRFALTARVGSRVLMACLISVLGALFLPGLAGTSPFGRRQQPAADAHKLAPDRSLSGAIGTDFNRPVEP